MAAHKRPASLRPRCTQSGSSVAALPVYVPPTAPYAGSCSVSRANSLFIHSLSMKIFMLASVLQRTGYMKLFDMCIDTRYVDTWENKRAH
jgi:hypothetical protein